MLTPRMFSMRLYVAREPFGFQTDELGGGLFLVTLTENAQLNCRSGGTGRRSGVWDCETAIAEGGARPAADPRL